MLQTLSPIGIRIRFSAFALTAAVCAMSVSSSRIAEGAVGDRDAGAGQAITEDVRPFGRRMHREAFEKGVVALSIDERERDRWHRAAGDVPLRVRDLPLDLARSVDLELERWSPVGPDTRSVVVGPDGRERPIRRMGRIWRGSVVGHPDSDVLLSDSPAGTFGWITIDGRMSIVSSGDPRGAKIPVVHELGDPTVAEIPWLPFQCGAEDLVHPDALAGTVPPEQGGLAGTICQVVQLAIDTDEEFLQLFGGSLEAAQSYLELLVAAADAIHGRDAGVRLQLVYSRLWSSLDPWTASGTQTQLTQFRDHWQNSMGGVFRDSAHLLSGRDLGGGMAWIGGLCTSFSYGVSANLTGFFPTPMADHDSQNWDPYVFAHELGHTLGSRHTHDTLHYDPPLDDCWIGESVGPCSMAYGGTLMSYCHQCSGGIANISLSLHPEVSARIAATVGGAACASDGPCVEDCNGNGVSDEFDLASGSSLDCDGNGVPDECDLDADGDGIPDACDVCPSDPMLTVSAPCGCGIAPIDCNGDGTADACEGGTALVPGESFPLPDGDAVGASSAIVVAADFEVAAIEVRIEGLVHERLGDLTASITHVESGRTSPLFVRVGRTGGGGGDNSNLDGDYVFADADAGDFWAAADAANNNGVVPGGRYAATGAGAGTAVSLDAVFGGHSSTGTWRLDLADESAGEPGQFAAWSLRLAEPDDGVEPCGGCSADLSGNGVVDGEDLGVFLIYWGTGQTSADLDGSGLVDAADLALVLDQWGACP